MSPQILIVIAAILAAGILLGVLLRASGAGPRSPADSTQPPAEPGSEGMHVADDGEIAPGAPRRRSG